MKLKVIIFIYLKYFNYFKILFIFNLLSNVQLSAKNKILFLFYNICFKSFQLSCLNFKNTQAYQEVAKESS